MTAHIEIQTDRTSGTVHGIPIDVSAACPVYHPNLEVTKRVAGTYFQQDNIITYNYDVTNTGDVAFDSLTVSDVFSAPFNGNMITVSGPLTENDQIIGDTDNNGAFDPTETWEFQGTATAPAIDGLSTPLTNTVTATEIIRGVEYTDTATLNLHPFILRKEVFLYWDSAENTKTYFDVTGITDNTPFGVTLYKDEVAVGTVTISKSSPAYLWLTDGVYKFLETDIPAGYITGYLDGFTFDTSKDYPDWTFPNVIGYDLYLIKTVPAYVFPTDTSVTYSITVSNKGPASLPTPIITDKTYDQPVNFIIENGYVKGDTNQNNLIDSGEEWSATFTAPLSGLVPDSYLKNTACVKDSALPTGSSSYIGGDTDMTNNCDTATVYVWWKGYTPGYWKNHPLEWPSPYLPNTKLTDVFTYVPKTLQADTFMTALNYKGGSGTTGAAQILLRSAVAALLNEQKFGNDYPPYATTSDLIAAVNAALATNDRTTMINLANTLDKWNNGYHP